MVILRTTTAMHDNNYTPPRPAPPRLPCISTKRYMFGLFCGLGPLWLPSFFSDDIPSMLPSMVDKNLSNRLRSSNPSSPPDHNASAIPANDDVHAADDVHGIAAPRTAPVIIPADDVHAADVQAIAAPSRTAPVSVGLD